jgi:hypothetical protein
MTNPAFWPPPPPRPVAKHSPSRRREQDCMDCGVDCSFATGIGHFYTVHRHIWLSVAPSSDGRLCLDCLQARLVRPLMAADFVATPFEILSRFLAGALDDAFYGSGW